MRLRLFLRRLTVSAPRMSVRSALPWPLRWVVLAIVLGFCASIGLWAFEFGKDIAGLDRDTKEELLQARSELSRLRAEVVTLKEARDKAQTIANTASTLLTTEKVVQEKLTAQVQQLETDKRGLQDDLGFFEKLIPVSGAGGIAIRGLQAEVHNGRELKWQVLVIQASKNAPEFNGQLELTFVGVQNGKPWTANLPGGVQTLKLKQYGRIAGIFELPAQAIVKGISAKILDGSVIKAAQTIKL
jgi:hypothetical protein